MTVLEYILDGLEAELALERELGVRAVEFDRTLLAPQKTKPAAPASPAAPAVHAAPAASATPAAPPSAPRTPSAPSIPSVPSVPSVPSTPSAPSTPSTPSTPRTPSTPSTPSVPSSPSTSTIYDIVFLHDSPLNAAGLEMMTKIISAMGRTQENTPIVTTEPRPPALFYVVLGKMALEKWFPGENASPGMWLASRGGADILVTYSPKFFQRFSQITPAIKKMKSDMWISLKGLMQRLRLKK